jgi:hypothetical protein
MMPARLDRMTTGMVAAGRCNDSVTTTADAAWLGRAAVAAET